MWRWVAPRDLHAQLLGNAVRGTGDMALPAGVLVACVLAHIAISPILIFGFGPLPPLGAAGAAWGLVLPFAVGGAWFVWYLHSGRAPVRLTFRGMAPRRELFADILKVGVPGLVNTAITNLSVAVLTGISAPHGTRHRHRLRDGRAARIHHAADRVRLRHRDFRDGRHQLGRPPVAPRPRHRDHRGKHRRGRVRSIGITVAIFPALWLGLFSDDPRFFASARLYLRIVAPLYLCFGMGLGLFFVSQGSAAAPRRPPPTGCASP